MSSSGNEEKTYRRFLELFLREMRPPLLEDQPVPMRPLTDLISEEEVEGECIDLCLQHLCKYNCPFTLAAGLARATADGVQQTDLSTYQCTKPPEEGKEPLTQLDSVKLARLVFNKLYEVCFSWLKEFPLRRRPQPYYETSIHAIKNMRRKMEDKHVVIPDFNTLFNLQDQEEQAFFAVFDGHGGVDAAIYAANHLHVNLVRQETFRQDPIEALCRAFRLTDERFVQKASREHLRCGTTGVVTFVRGRTLYVAWLGDSQVMLVKKGEAVELMKPHKPDREDEKQRIEALGGCVIWFGTWRVNGSLSVSRAIGDSEHKPYICGEADHSVLPLDGTEDYLILACDGFYDTVKPEEAVRIVSDHLAENAGDTAMVAHKLVASARDAGSSDNITVIVVFLRDPRAPPPHSQASRDGDEEAADNIGQSEEQSEDGGDQEGMGMAGDGGGKNRGGWPLQQCSAPADLAYEERNDSFTDRTSLSRDVGGAGFVSGPSLVGIFRNLPARSKRPPLRAFAAPLRLPPSWRLSSVEEGLCVYRSGNGLLPSTSSSSSHLLLTTCTDGLLPPTENLLPLATLMCCGVRRRRRVKRLVLRREGPLERLRPMSQMLPRQPLGLPTAALLPRLSSL